MIRLIVITGPSPRVIVRMRPDAVTVLRVPERVVLR